ncbi:hypothetical protein FJW07_29865 [Mesorhizobium sp. B3-1-9]|uniref:hypothetical protein n=1 Tax=Mesorhizobium sp. B3-1-9 TaxID=2589892 RepID=UPI0011265893|nr:hypothetical protein [Mesorhizobium sp. B3-1-9]TPI29999.1 hypothetical protein FJW07_29865 [Mesorhizobium sp. B3-1-9]
MADLGSGQAPPPAPALTPPVKNSTLFKDSVFLAALIGAIIAGLANAYVAFINNNTLVDVENHKEAQERYMEVRKAELARLLEITKLDVAPAREKVKAFCDMFLITDQAVCGASKSAQTTPPTNTAKPVIASWDSPWVGGGHSQEEMCNVGLAALTNGQYKGKTLTIQTMSEDSNKDFLGHVTYRYHCTYLVS